MHAGARRLATSRWLIPSLAGLGVIVLTGAANLQGQRISRQANLPVPADAMERRLLEADLVRLFDQVAERNGLSCKMCDRLSNGRSYVVHDEPRSSLALTANFDPATGRVYYDVQAFAASREPKPLDDVDSIRTEIEQALRADFADPPIATVEHPPIHFTLIHVAKALRSSSFRDPENQRAYQRALAIIEQIASAHGMNQAHAGMYYLGRLLGPATYERDLTLGAAIADTPLISIQIDRRSADFEALHRQIAQELETRLRKEFGEKRVSVR